jgi:hypothetical protein
MLAHGFDVLDQGLGGVSRQRAQVILNRGRASAAAALMQPDGPEF